MPISLCMIVKNEENNLKRCLNSVADIVDEMIIVDTGSTDSTVQIAQSYGAKVYHFEWNDNFSEARNFSLKQASCHWILLMDADDELDQSGKEVLLEKSQTGDADAYFFETVSYVGENPGSDVLKNRSPRLMRNFKGYFFSNPIHEQLYCNIVAVNPAAKIENLPVVVYHYGYLKQNIAEKDKRARNIRLLKNELKENPLYPFALFNLGSEYYAEGDNRKAIGFFEQSYRNFNPAEGFSPHLLLKMAHCYCALGRYAEASQICGEGLSHYPFFTDLEYMRGIVCMATAKQLCAIGHFKKCCEMGEAPSPFNVIAGTGTYRAHYMMGQLYFDLFDYESAAQSFKSALLSRPNCAAAFVLYVRSRCSLRTPSDALEADIRALSAQSAELGIELLIDPLIKEKYFDLALLFIDELSAASKELTPIEQYRKGICLLYKKKYDEAEKTFRTLNKIPAFKERALCMQALCRVSLGKLPGAEKLLVQSNQERHPQISVFKAFLSLLKTGSTPVLDTDEANSGLYLPAIFEILRVLLYTNQFESLKKALYLLNTITSKTALMDLAKLYYEEGCYGLAYKELIRSVQLYEVLDTEGAKMLSTLKTMGF